jgi:16S rRNA (guanine966-N2)-methyltransferase
VDLDPKYILKIRQNLKTTRLENRAEIIRSDSFRYLDRTKHDSFDLIYIAPPQYKDLWVRALQAIDLHPAWLVPDGIAVVQIDPKEHNDILLNHLHEFDRRRYGNTLLIFYECPEE